MILQCQRDFFEVKLGIYGSVNDSRNLILFLNV